MSTREVGAAGLLRDAAVFLVGGLGIGGVLVQPIAPRLLGLGRPLLAGDEADSLVQSFDDRIIQGDAVNAVILAALAGILDVLVERVVDAVVGADQADLVTPHRQRQGGLQQLLQGLMERRLVDHHIALQAAQVARPATQGLDLPPRLREADHVGQDLFLLPSSQKVCS
ncbi:hypothetical protein P4132_30150 [Pseudomonas aeruginosa]|nr:hypothetical protein [Pseudomonas aeruginosa]